jgi:hypothetical protein
MVSQRSSVGLARVQRAVDALELPPAVFMKCPFQPQELVETGLRQWLRCCGAAMLGRQIIGMPSYAVDEAWHGFILCTARYATFCEDAYGQFLHHYPEGGEPSDKASVADSLHDQFDNTALAWSYVAKPGEECVLWDLDERVGVADPWGTGAKASLSESMTS